MENLIKINRNVNELVNFQIEYVDNCFHLLKLLIRQKLCRSE